MYVYVFEGPEGVLGFATHSDGLTLPATHRPWVLINRLIMSDDDDDRPIVRTRECMDDIQRYGFHLTQGNRRVTEILIGKSNL